MYNRSFILSLVFLSAFFHSEIFAQFQLGQDIDGEQGDDRSGASVSINSAGDRVAIGAINNDGNGSNSGHVRVYEYSSGSWTQLGSDIDGEASSDQSGHSVSLNSAGDRVAIGAINNDGNGSNSGHVKVYEYSDSSWTQMGIDIDGEAADDYSGYSVSINSVGDRVAIGAYNNDGNGSNSGHVRVYEYSSSSWNKLGDDIDGEASIDHSGASVSINSSGDRVAIGAYNNDANGSNSGHVRVYEYSSGSWTQLGIDIDGEAAHNNSGYSVSMNSSGDRVAIGATSNDGNGDNAGHVRVYDLVNGSWTQVGEDIDGEVFYDKSGWSVSMNSSGDRVAIGALHNDGNGGDSGHARIYEYSSGSWTQLKMDIDGEASYTYSGFSVSLDSSGSRVAISAPWNDDNEYDSGHVRVFDFSGGPVWHVSKTGSDLNNGTESSPLLTIQRAIDAATNGDTILVASGTYTENITCTSDKNITLASLYLTTQDTSYISSTIINGDADDVVLYMHMNSGSMKLVGFTLTNGAKGENYGGGIHVVGLDTLIINHVVVRNNTSEECCGTSGGIYTSGVDYVRIENSKISDNEQPDTQGGGLNVGGANWFKMTNTLIEGNTSKGYGAVNIYSDEIQIINCTIANNKNDCTGCTDGLYVSTSSSLDSILIMNTIVAQNSSWDNTDDVYYVRNRDMGFSNGKVVLINNYTGLYYHVGQDRVKRSVGNIFTEKNLFLDMSKDNYSLTSFSSAIGGGLASVSYDGNTVSAPTKDINGLSRGALPDLGAIENSLNQKLTVAYVSKNGSDSNVGTSASPFLTIQKGIDATSDGDTVLVAPGTYTENITHTSGTGITLASQYLTTQDTSYISSTIVDGNENGPVIYMSNNSTSFNLIGLTLTNGGAIDDPYNCSSCVIGGGIYGYQGDSLVLDHMVIRDNYTESSTTSGGVRANNFKYVKIADTKISDNESPDYYGALNISTDDFEMTNTLVEGNESNYQTVYISISNDVEHIKIINNTVANNKTENSSTAFQINMTASSDSVLFMNNIVSQNYQYNSNEDQYDLMSNSVGFSNGKVVMLNNYINPNISGSDRIKRSSGNFFNTTSPFVNAVGGNYNLGIFSGAVGNGIASAHYDGNTVLAPTKDLNDVDRPNPSRSSPDMGALESSYAKKLNIINVSTAGSDSNTGTEESPLLTIQRALDIASSGDTVLLAQGTYSENISLLRGLSVTIGSRYLTTKDTSYINSTIINGNNQGPTIHINTWDKDKASMYLSGVTVTGGAFDEDVYVPCFPCYAAGAIFAYNLDTLFADHVTIKNNTGHEGTGGGIRVTGASQTNTLVKITNSNIYNNTSYYGQPVQIDNTTKIEISNTIISNNNTENPRTGLSFSGPDTAIVVNTTIANNKNTNNANSEPLYISMSSGVDSVLIMNSIISQNKGYDNSLDSFLTYYEQIVVGNGRVVFLNNYTSESFSNNSKIKRSSGNVFTSADPFVNIDQNNYALSPGSHAIGKGTISDTYYGSTITAPSTDIFGNSRPTPNGTNPDIGAIENSRGIRDNIAFSVKQDGTGDYEIIQNAINNSDIIDGDTLLVYPGTYTENFYINDKNIVLMSLSGPFETHIVPSQPSTHTLTLSNTNSEITGFSFSGSSYGAASVDASGGAPRISNCRFYDNQSNNSIKFHGANAILENILFYNYEGSQNHGFYWDNSCSPVIRNSTIINYGGWVFNGGDFANGAVIYFENSIIKGLSESNQAFEGPYDITYSAVSPDIGGATNLSFSGDQWSNVFKDTVSGDYRLSDYSPCIGAGTPINAPEKDILGNPRPNPTQSSPDLGAFESEYSSQRPRAGSVADGLDPGADIFWSNSTGTMSANWWGFTDNDIISYQYAVGDLDVVSDDGASYLTEDFNSSFSSSIPDGWMQNSTVSGGGTRDFSIQGNNGVDNSQYIWVNVYVEGDVAALISPEVGPVNEGDSLFFYYRAIDYGNQGSVVLNNGDGMNVYFETSDSFNRTLLWSIDHNHSPTSEWQEASILLPSFSSQYGSFVFEALDNEGGNDWYACFDEIRVGALTTVHGVDNVLSWTSNGADTSAVISGLSLINGESYSVSVRAVDQDSQVSDTVYTDGVTIDATPPVVFDAIEGYITEPEAQSTYSLSFDGDDDYVEIPHSGELDFGNGSALTIAAWVYPIIHEGESTILMKGQYGYGFALTWDGSSNCSPNNAQNLVYWDQSSCWEAINSMITYEFDQWQHVAVTVQDIGNELEIYFYVDGVQDGPHYSNQANISNGGNFQPLRIGDQGGQGSNPFFGNISNLAIWSTVLSENIISTMAGQYDLSFATPATAHWDFSDGSGSVLSDQSGNGNSGNISGAFWSDDIHTPPFEGEIIDMDFQQDTSQLQVFWSGYDDNSGVEYYEHSVGTYPGGTDTNPWTNTGTGITDIITGLNLADGQNYYLNVRAWDIAGNVSDVTSSDGVVIDISPPIGTIVNDGAGDDISYTASDTALSANWPAFREVTTQITKYEVSLGTAAGNTDVLDWVDNGLSTSFSIDDMQFLSQWLTNGVMYFTNVRAGDEAGNVSDPISSDGVVVDTQGPDNVFVFDGLGQEDDDYTNTTETISGYWNFNDPLSGIHFYEYAVGTETDSFALATWQSAGADTFFIESDLTLISGETYYVFVKATDNVNNTGSVAVSDGITVDLLVPEVETVYDGYPGENIAWQSSDSTISLHWTGSDTREIFFYEYSVGTMEEDSNTVDWIDIGSNTDVTVDSLELIQGTTYFGNVRAFDGANNVSAVSSSDGITIDYTAPEIGTVTDGLESDLIFTGSADSLSAHWDGFTDSLSGILHLEYAVGTFPSGSDVVEWTITLDSSMVESGLSLESGSVYYVSVRAVDQALNISPSSSSNGVVVDITAPAIGTVSDGMGLDEEWTNSFTTLYGNWSGFTDIISGIDFYEYAIGTSSGGTNIIDWEMTGLDTSFLRDDLELLSSFTYYTSVRATDLVGNTSIVAVSDGITVDVLIPTVDIPLDGNSQEDLDWQSSTNSLSVHWTATDTRDRQMDYFEYAVSTVPGDSNVVSWTNSGANNSATITGLSLSEGITYYSNIRAYDAAGNRSSTVSTDGITIDVTAPAAGGVTDGQGADINFTSSGNSLEGHWSGFVDDLSGLSYYHVAVGTNTGFLDIVPWTNVSLDTQIVFNGLSLVNGQAYYLSVKAYDRAQNESQTASSNGVVSDQAGPESGDVSDGISEDIEWVISPSELEASWSSFNDSLSGIKHYEYAVGDSPEGVNILSWTNIGLENQVLIQGLPLSHGSQYYIGVRGVDSVDNIGPSSFSNGLTVDLVLPNVTGVIESETAGVVGSNQNDTLDMDYMNQADTIIISWNGEDTFSGLEYFETSLGTVEGDDDIVSWVVIDNPNIFSKELFNLGLQNGTTYFANVRARDVAGNISDIVSGDGVLIDLTPPLKGEVIDGQVEDQVFTSSSDTLISSWSGFSDDISGIEYFEYSIGTTDLGGAEILDWISAGPETEFFQEDGLQLENAQTYYAAVRATDFAGNVSNLSVSNGITIDLTDLELLTSTLEHESYLPMDDIPMLSYSFSEAVKSGSVEISGNVSGSISTTVLDSSISIEFLGPFASLDTFNIITFVDDYSGKDSLTLDYIFYTDLLADYNQDLTIDIQDLTEFVTVWNNTDLTGELGPFTGTVPQVTVSLDGALDLRDIMAFTRMWHWSHATPLIIAGRNQDGPDLIAEQDGNSIIIMPPQETLAIQVAVKYPAERRDILQPLDSQINDEIKLSKKEKDNGIVLVEKAFLKQTMEKKVILETISLDKSLAAIDIHYISYGPDGSVISSGMKALDIVAVPREFALRQNYPNPFNPITHIRYEIPDSGPVEIVVYDILGKEVASLLNADIQAGYHSIAWRGLNKNGQPVGAGVYFAQFRSKGLTKTIKMLLLK